MSIKEDGTSLHPPPLSSNQEDNDAKFWDAVTVEEVDWAFTASYEMSGGIGLLCGVTACFMPAELEQKLKSRRAYMW